MSYQSPAQPIQSLSTSVLTATPYLQSLPSSIWVLLSHPNCLGPNMSTTSARPQSTNSALIYQKFSNATPQAHSHIFRSAVLPKLDYCSSVWDPHFSTPVSSLEFVQKFACHVITKQWRCDYETLLSNLGQQTLKTCHKLQKLKVCYTILDHQSCIPATTFTPHSCPSLCLHHNKALFAPYVRTVAHKLSFFIDIIPLWNSLPSVIVNSPSSSSFKSIQAQAAFCFKAFALLDSFYVHHYLYFCLDCTNPVHQLFLSCLLTCSLYAFVFLIILSFYIQFLYKSLR